MTDVPANQRLWQMLVLQAKAKFAKYPSLPASKWIHTEYVNKGGRFVTQKQLSTADKAIAKKRDDAADAKNKKEKGEK